MAGVQRGLMRSLAVVLVAVVSVAVAQLHYQRTTLESVGIVEFYASEVGHEVRYLGPDGQERTARAPSQLVMAETDEPRIAQPGELVPVRIDRSDPGAVLIAEPAIFGMTGLAFTLVLLIVVMAAALAINPEYILARVPSDVREDHGYYWQR